MSRRDIVMEYFNKDKDYMKEKVEYGIEQYRKGDAVIEVADKNGKTLPGAKIKAIQKNHEFKFGANIFMLDELETDEKNEKYRQYFKDMFNMATLPFYWSDLEPQKGHQRYEKNSPKIYRRPSTDLCMEFCEENGIEPREHALAYEHYFPDWLKDESVFTIKNELTRRFREISERYAARIPTIEVTNEMFWGKGTTSFFEDDEYVEWCFKTAEKYFPQNELVINEGVTIYLEDGRNRDKYYMEIERAINKGARIDSIGTQFHMFFKSKDEINYISKYYNPRHLYKVLDRYSDFKLPIQITEVTIPAYTDGEEDEQLQAEIIRNLYSLWFSHPNIEQVIYWNLVDGYAAFAPQGDMNSGENYYRGGLLRFDFTQKPAYSMLKKLIHEEWHTEKELITGEDGVASFRGFYGTYDVTVEVNGKNIKTQIYLGKGRNNKFTVNI